MSPDLDAVRARQAAYVASHDHPGAFACCSAHASADDVPDLLDEAEHASAEQRAWTVPFVVYAIQHHDLRPDAKAVTPGVDCKIWCQSCRLLPSVPADVVAAANARIREYEELDALEPPF